MKHKDNGKLAAQTTEWSEGLTKREMIAMHLYAGMLTATDEDGQLKALDCADIAVEEADNLLKALEEVT